MRASTRSKDGSWTLVRAVGVQAVAARMGVGALVVQTGQVVACSGHDAVETVSYFLSLALSYPIKHGRNKTVVAIQLFSHLLPLHQAGISALEHP